MLRSTTYTTHCHCTVGHYHPQGHQTRISGLEPPLSNETSVKHQFRFKCSFWPRSCSLCPFSRYSASPTHCTWFQWACEWGGVVVALQCLYNCAYWHANIYLPPWTCNITDMRASAVATGHWFPVDSECRIILSLWFGNQRMEDFCNNSKS